MKKILLLFLLLFSFSFLYIFNLNASEKQRSYFISINFNRGNLSIGNVDVGFSYLNSDTIYKNKNAYKLMLISFSGKVLAENTFNINSEISADSVNDLLEVEQDNARAEEMEILIVMSYFKDAEKILLLNSNEKLVDQKDISHLAEVCGDGECADYENYLSCEKDCPASGQDGYCNEQEIEKDPDCIIKKSEKGNKLVNICNNDNICLSPETPQNCPGDCLESKSINNKAKNQIETVKTKNNEFSNIQIIIFLIIIFSIILIMFLAYYFLIRKKSNQKE